MLWFILDICITVKTYTGLVMSNTGVSYINQEQPTLRENLGSLPVFTRGQWCSSYYEFSVLSFCFICFHSLSCAHCNLWLWICHCWLSLLYLVPNVTCDSGFVIVDCPFFILCPMLPVTLDLSLLIVLSLSCAQCYPWLWICHCWLSLQCSLLLHLFTSDAYKLPVYFKQIPYCLFSTICFVFLYLMCKSCCHHLRTMYYMFYC